MQFLDRSIVRKTSNHSKRTCGDANFVFSDAGLISCLADLRLHLRNEGSNAFEFKGTNGFMLTFDMTSKDVAPNKASMS